MVDGDEMIMGVWNRKDIVQIKWAGGVGQKRFTNVHDFHTCPIFRSNVVDAIVAVLHGEPLELLDDVVYGPVPIWIIASR
jgi:hypothetical protein